PRVPIARGGGRHSAGPPRSRRPDGRAGGAARPRHGGPPTGGPAERLGRWGQAVGDLAARGLAAATRAPRSVRIAAAAGLATLVLAVVVLTVVSEDDPETRPGPDAAPGPSAGPGDQPLLAVQEYAGRGVRINIPADWSVV